MMSLTAAQIGELTALLKALADFARKEVAEDMRISNMYNVDFLAAANPLLIQFFEKGGQCCCIFNHIIVLADKTLHNGIRGQNFHLRCTKL